MKIDSLVFDYGNTLVEFGSRQIRRCDEALMAAVESLCGPVDRRRFQQIRETNRRAPFAGARPSFRENDLRRITAELLGELAGAGAGPDPMAVEHLMRVRSEVFVSVIEAPNYLHDLLDRLRSKYRLALLSNYPSGDDVRTSLDRIDIARYFEVVVVSADVGFVKPHPQPFRTVFQGLGIAPEQALHVGDSWFADVQGAGRIGAQVAWTRQFEALERTRPRADDLRPDLEIEHLRELLDRL